MTTPTPDRTPTGDLRERLEAAMRRDDFSITTMAAAVLPVVEAETAALRERLAHRHGEWQRELDARIAAEQKLQDAERQRDEALAAVQRVRDLHQPTKGMGFDCDEDDTPGSYGDIAEVCTSCGAADEYGVRWPCPTIAALDQPEDT